MRRPCRRDSARHAARSAGLGSDDIIYPENHYRCLAAELMALGLTLSGSTTPRIDVHGLSSVHVPNLRLHALLVLCCATHQRIDLIKAGILCQSLWYYSPWHRQRPRWPIAHVPPTVEAYARSLSASSTSGAPPPATSSLSSTARLPRAVRPPWHDPAHSTTCSVPPL